MALAGTTCLDVRTTATANDVNGGGFDPANANMATDLAATSGNTAIPVVTSASYTFVAGDVGHWLFVKSGTNWNPGWYQIASVATGAATLSAAIGAWESYTANGTGTPMIAPGAVVGAATVASPSAGTWSVDYSRTDSARIAYTDIAVGGTNTQFTSAANPVGKNIIGNIINVISGTSFTVQRVQVVSTAGTTGTVDKSFGGTSLSGGTGNLGGAFSSPGAAMALAAVNFMQVFAKTGTYTCTTATAGSNGPVVLPAFLVKLEGYDVVRGDRTANRPILSGGAVTFGANTYLVSNSGTGAQAIVNFVVDGNNLSNCSGFSIGGGNACSITQCEARNCSGSGCFGFNGAGQADSCKATNCTTAFQGTQVARNCWAALSAGQTGFNGVITCSRCLVTGGATGFSPTAAGRLDRCTADSCTTNGFTDSIRCEFHDCIASNCGGSAKGFNVSTSTYMVNCAGYNNATNINGTYFVNTNFIALTADPYVSQATNDFRLNNNTPGGGQLRGKGLGVAGQIDNNDIGAVQHTDPAGGGGVTSFAY